jgi:hypothetical protein
MRDRGVVRLGRGLPPRTSADATMTSVPHRQPVSCGVAWVRNGFKYLRSARSAKGFGVHGAASQLYLRKFTRGCR